MKMKRKLTVVLIAVCLVTAMIPTLAFADTKEKTEFVAVPRESIKTVDTDGIITLKKAAPKPTAESINVLENGWPILFAEKQGEGDTAIYTVIQDMDKVSCKDTTVKLAINMREEPDGNMGTYGESSEAYTTAAANIFVQKIGVYTFVYKGQKVKIEIKLPDYGFYTKPTASIKNQLLNAYCFDESKENVVYMIAANPEKMKSINFTFHSEEMAECASLEQMGDHGEICKITIKKPIDYIWLHCGREFLNGDFDNSGEAFRIVLKPEKVLLKKISSSKKAITLTWKKQENVTYEVKFATNKAFTKNVNSYFVDGSTKTKFRGLTKGKRYYAKVRAYRSGTYGKWSNVKSIVCK